MSTPAQQAAGDAVPGLSVSVTGEIILAAIIIFFFLFVFLLILFLRANRCLGANPVLQSYPVRFVFPSAALPGRALDPAVLKSLQVTTFRSVDFKDGKECAVCLSELADGEAVRLLPCCNHGFHLECIDMWFSSNSTCPICRSSVEPPSVDSKNVILGDSEPSPVINDRALQQDTVMPADGSGEGSSNSVSLGSRKPGRILAIDMPRIAFESSAFALHSSRILAAVEVQLPTLASLRSLRRILSMGSRGFSSACNYKRWDIEQGAAAAAAAAVFRSGGEGSSSSKNCKRDLSSVEEVLHVKEEKRIALR